MAGTGSIFEVKHIRRGELIFLDRDLKVRIRALRSQDQSLAVLKELAILYQRYSLDLVETPFQSWLDALESGTKKQQMEALAKIESLGAAALFALPVMLERLKAPAKFRRRLILRIIEKLGCAAGPILVATYWKGPSPATPWIVFALGTLKGSPESFEVLCDAFRSKRLDVELKAVMAFRSCPSFSTEIDNLLRPLILRDNTDLAYHAIQTLQVLNCQSGALFNTLTTALAKGRNSQVRRCAAGALTQFKEQVRDIQTELIDALADAKEVGDAVVDNFQFIETLNDAQLLRFKDHLASERIDIRINALRALEYIGKPAERLVPRIVAQFRHDEYWLPQIAVEALIAIAKDDPDLEARLRRQLSDDDKQVRQYSAAALGYFTPSTVILGSLASLLEDPCPMVRGAVFKSMGQLKAPASLCLNHLMRALLSTEFRESFEAARSIRDLSGDCSPAFHTLLNTLHHSNEGLRREAVLSLMIFSERKAEIVPKFLALLAREHRTSVLLILIECVVNLDRDQDDVWESIESLYDHPNSSVAEKAIQVRKLRKR